MGVYPLNLTAVLSLCKTGEKENMGVYPLNLTAV